MGNVNALLAKRLKKNDKNSKMAEMAKQSATGKLTSFSGMFSVLELSENEKRLLQAILFEYSTNQSDTSIDLQSLAAITSEIKAINNQAAMLHGERIQRAREVLIKYQEGAFTAWLIAAYGNRQTPYNFLKYYEFYHAMPKKLRSQIEMMPRQAIYTLASREGDFDKKQHIVKSFRGQTKHELLNMIRDVFPLEEEDGRKEKVAETIIQALIRIKARVKHNRTTIGKSKKHEIVSLLDELYALIDLCKVK